MSRKVLIVEDNADCREIIISFLRYKGYKVIAAENGAQSINKAVSESPDVVVLDLGLPDVSGIEVAALLKQDPKTSRIPIVIHSGWPPENWKEKAFQAGAGAYLTKPASPTMLQMTIEKLIEDGKASSRPQARTSLKQAEENKNNLRALLPGLHHLEDDLYILDLGERSFVALSDRDLSSGLLMDRVKHLYARLTDDSPDLARNISDFGLSSEAWIDKVARDYEWKKEIVAAKERIKKQLKPTD